MLGLNYGMKQKQHVVSLPHTISAQGVFPNYECTDTLLVMHDSLLISFFFCSSIVLCINQGKKQLLHVHSLHMNGTVMFVSNLLHLLLCFLVPIVLGLKQGMEGQLHVLSLLDNIGIKRIMS